MHKTVVVDAALRRNKAEQPTHLWIECQADEVFNWTDVSELLEAGYKVTAQIREPRDVPPQELREDPDFAVVWMIPTAYREVLACAGYIKDARAPGDGYEIKVVRQMFNSRHYAEDRVWPN